MPGSRASTPTAFHWGGYEAVRHNDDLTALQPMSQDDDPSSIGAGFLQARTGPARITAPAVRESVLLGDGPADGAGRGAEPFVAVDWDTALSLVARGLDRVIAQHGNRAVFAGSYGWASAGRFHHAQSQIHRFFNTLGGYVRSVNTYSTAAAEVILPHVIGSMRQVTREATSWPVIAKHSRLVVMFGGWPLKNAQVNAGGVAAHSTRAWMERCAKAGVRFVNVSPLQGDADPCLGAEWWPVRPNTDVAVMLGVAHTLVEEGLHDEAFLNRYCVGFDRFRPYLTGETDGRPKDAAWAAEISGLAPEAIRSLARDMAATRSLVSVSWSVQRADHGEQPYWMAVVLAAMLGQIGLPGGGFAAGLSAMHGVGNPSPQLDWAALPQGVNGVRDFIPVARISDMLLQPGAPFDYNGQRYQYPDIRLVYWCGGNPFHHHQDLNRLVRAWSMPETVICHECWWNPLARHADIVLPVTTPVERNDFAATTLEGSAVAMHQAVPKFAQSRDDYEIFSDLAARLGVEASFTEGRDETDWLRHLYNVSRQRHARSGFELPDFEGFWDQGILTFGDAPVERVLMEAFRRDPEANPLKTPSGRIEIFSETIAGFGYDDCPGHPVWLEPAEWLGSVQSGRFPLHLISNQPKTRLHSQLDNGPVSRAAKIVGREPVHLNPEDAARRGISDGDIVRLFNDRGACLAGACLDPGVRPGVVRLATGAWFDPRPSGREGALDVHGNPNVLTLDKGTSRLAQGPIAQTCLIEVERFDGPAPPVCVFDPPEITSVPRT